MSELTITRPEVLTDHTDVICSTSIERIITGRNSALKQIQTLIQHVADISTLTSSIGGKTALDWAMKQDFRCGCWLMEKREAAMKAITRNLDRDIQRDLMKRSGMLSITDAQAREQWYNSLEEGDLPAISETNIRYNPAKNIYEDEFFSIRYYQKGTAHLSFKHLELIERMNEIIAKRYPGMLAIEMMGGLMLSSPQVVIVDAQRQRYARL